MSAGLYYNVPMQRTREDYSRAEVVARAARPCAVPGCERPAPVGVRTMCAAHHSRRHRGWPWERLVGQPIRTVGTIMRNCSVEGCDRPHMAKGFCVGHCTRAKKGATAEQMKIPLFGMMNGKPMLPQICVVDGCGGHARARGMCGKHYQAAHPYVKAECVRDGCGKPVRNRARRFCSRACAYAADADRAEAAYVARQGAGAWAAIAESLGFKTWAGAFQAARRHAHRNDLAWPIR